MKNGDDSPSQNERRREAIRRFQKKHGLKYKPWGEKAGVSESTIRNYLKDGSQVGSLELSTLDKLAKAADATVAEMIGDAHTEVEVLGKDLIKIYVRGEVQAGAWGETMELPAEEWSTVVLTKPDEHKEYFGLRVIGSSMNLEYPPGTILICVKIHDYLYNIAEGLHVIVRRTNLQGLIEMTVKEIREDETGNIWLWPRSSDPQWQTPIPLPRPDVNHDGIGDGDETQLIAVVVHSVKPAPRGSKPIHLW